MMSGFIFFCMFFIAVTFVKVKAAEIDYDKVLSSIEESYLKVRDYTCIMCNKELVDKEIVSSDNTFYKHKKPDNYYVKYNAGSYSGMEVIYAGKKYNYQLLVHLGGLLNIKNFKLNPKGSRAMKKNRHSILESDLGFMIKVMRNNFNKARSAREGYFSFEGETNVNGRSVLVYKSIFPQSKGYYARQIESYVDKQLNLPIKLVVTGWDNKLLEMYQLNNLKINCGLTDTDFDDHNPNYGF